MPVFVVIFYGLALFTVGATCLGASGKPRWYWWAAFTSYVCSFLGGFSIGLYLLSLTFALVVLATAHSLRLIRAWWQSALAVALGFLLWWVSVNTVDDAWLFLPFRLLLSPLLSSGT